MNLDEITDDEIAAALDSEYSDCRGVAWFDSHGLSKQHELLLFRAEDACLGALHHICCDDVACELCEGNDIFPGGPRRITKGFANLLQA